MDMSNNPGLKGAAQTARDQLALTTEDILVGRTLPVTNWHGPSVKSGRKKIYIAGPMRGYPNFNFPAFYAAEEYLTDEGWEVGNPARMDDDDFMDFTVLPGNAGIRLAMERDLVWIAKEANAIYMLKGWEQSNGANAEWTLAKTLGLEIYYQETI